jgi:saccharopine dehydrogenase-like NADP-dependent oxidoreductase
LKPHVREAALKIVVLGGGRVGHAIVRDLAANDDYNVFVADVDPVVLLDLESVGATGIPMDLSTEENVAAAVADADLVVSAVPGFMGYETVERVLAQKKPVVDISYFEEDAFELQEAAKEAGVPCLVDAGISPGLSNVLLGHLEDELDEISSYECFVGGLPVERSWPWEYKAPFSPGDVIEVYTRSARLRVNGEEVTVPALSDPELVEFPGLGTLEAFNTDGLRSLLLTSDIPNMVEKTIRYPGHAERMRVFREAGFFGDRQVMTESGPVRPRDVTESLLFSQWKFEEGEPDLTVMRVTVEGKKDEKDFRYTYSLLDYYNTDTEISSMARTTGYTCNAMVNILAKGLWSEAGVASPEMVGRNSECHDFVVDYLAERNVQVFLRIDELD